MMAPSSPYGSWPPNAIISNSYHNYDKKSKYFDMMEAYVIRLIQDTLINL